MCLVRVKYKDKSKIKFIKDKVTTKKVALRNVPFVVLRWPVVEPKLKHLYKFKTYLLFLYPFKDKFIDIGYTQLISEKKNSHLKK